MTLLKTFHLIAIVFWIGPGFGAYWILFRLGRDLSEEKRRCLEKYYEQVLRMEHFFFGAVLATGLGMLWVVGWDWASLPWLKTKLFLVGGVLLIELADIGLAHFWFRRLILSGKSFQDPAWRRALKFRKIFYLLSLPLMAGMVLAIFYLALAKTL